MSCEVVTRANEAPMDDADTATSQEESCAPRSLRDRKKVVYNEKELIKRASTDSDDDDDDLKPLDLDDEDVDDEARRQPLELWADETDSGSQSGADVRGQSVFGFKMSKRKGALAKSVSYSTGMEEEGANTPSKTIKKDDVLKTPSRDKRGRAPKSHLAKTPHRLRRRMDQVVDESDSDHSFSEGSDDDDDDDDDYDSDESDKSSRKINNNETKNRNKIPGAPATPTLNKRATPLKVKRTRSLSRRKLNVQEDKTASQQAEEAESYFEAHKSSQAMTSDRTLSKLETPKLSPEQVASLLADSPSHHAEQIQELLQSHASLFRKWMVQLASGFSVLLYGLGSKRQLLEMFRMAFLEGEYHHVTINGYFPGLTVKQIFNCILEELFDHGYRSFKNATDQLDFLRKHLLSEPRDFFVIIHNIDGANLRKEKTQQALSQMASLPCCHLVASIDHINSPMLWDQAKLSQFRWLWHDATTFCPYIDETSYETSLMIQQTGQLALSSLLHVIKSLTPNAKKIFVLLATEQLALGDTPMYQGMSFHDLYQRCRAEFLVNSDLTLRAQLTEFKDHKLIRVKKSNDGVEYLTISLDNATIIEFMEDYES